MLCVHFTGIDAVATTRGLLLLECAMLNCVLKFPLSEISEDNVQLLLSMLYKHLEDIPHLEDSQNMVIKCNGIACYSLLKHE